MKLSQKSNQQQSQTSMTRNYNIHHVSGTHLSIADRLRIEFVYNSNLRLPKKDRVSLRQLAKDLGLSVSTLHREIKRGRVTTPNTFQGRDIWDYSAQKAQDNISDGYLNKGCPMKLTNVIAKLLQSLIVNEHRSPYDALEELKEQGFEDLPCEQTVYNHIHDGSLQITLKDTPYGLSKRKGKKRPPRRANKAPGAISIEDRPKGVEERDEFGHWEMDTVVSRVGGKGGLLVLIERKTRYYIIKKLKSIAQADVTAALKQIIRSGEMKCVISITTDNGSEFLHHPQITKLFKSINNDFVLYFTHAYASWEKGSVENANRMVRRVYPKGTDFRDVTKKQIAELQTFINSIHRRNSQNGQTAQKSYEQIA